MKIDVMSMENINCSKDVNIGYAIKKDFGKEAMSLDKEITLFLQDKDFFSISFLVVKLIERFPFKYKLIKGLTCLIQSLSLSQMTERISLQL